MKNIQSVIIFRLITTILLLLSSLLSFAQVQQSKTANLMGSVFQITLVDKDSIAANQHILDVIAEMERIENLISEWRPNTQISEVNRNAGIKPLKVDKEVFELTKRAIGFSKMTKGAFDISIVAMDKIWFFDGTMEQLPSKKDIKKSVTKVNYKNIVLDSVNSTIFLTKKGMKIGFGSIGKGYAADKGRQLMQSLGVKAGIVNASGDMATWGNQLDGNSWRIGVNNPFETGEMVEILEFSSNNAVSTSGSYEKYAEIDGKRYSHIINPKTGYPSTGITSVTIIGESAEFCNGLSTSVMVLGLKKGLKLLRKHPELRYIILTDTGEIIKN
jgi:thiamine biosynthesis lipoprotein